MLKVNSWCSGVLRVIKDLGAVVNSHNSIRAVLSKKFNFTNLFTCNGFDALSSFEVNLSRLIIINDGNSSLCVFAFKLLKQISIVSIIQLYKEVLIWFPVFVIDNIYINKSISLPSIE